MGSAGQDVGQDRCQGAEGLSPVGDGVLLLRRHLGGGSAPTAWLILLDGHEDRVVAEAPLTPVSYTHLDVYKRQVLSRPEAQWPPGSLSP